MSADNVIKLAPRSAPGAGPAKRRKSISPAVELMASGESVMMLVGDQDDGVEVWLSPEEADRLGDSLKRFARVAKGLGCPAEPTTAPEVVK